MKKGTPNRRLVPVTQSSRVFQLQQTVFFCTRTASPAVACVHAGYPRRRFEFNNSTMAIFELFVQELLEWKLAFLAVPTLIIAWLICKFLFLDALRSPLRSLPGPRPSLFLGNIPEIKRKEFLGATAEWSKKYGGIFVMWLRPGMYMHISAGHYRSREV